MTPHGFSGRNVVRGVICTLKKLCFEQIFNRSLNFESLPPLISGINLKFCYALLLFQNLNLVSQTLVLKLYLCQKLCKKNLWPDPPLNQEGLKLISVLYGLSAVSNYCVSFQLGCTDLVAGQVMDFLKVRSMENSNLAVVLIFRLPFKIYRGLMLHVKGFAYMFPHKKEKYVDF